MNAPANIQSQDLMEWSTTERAHRASISLHLPNEGPDKMACRVALAILRDQASVGKRSCSDAAYGLLGEVERQATNAVFAPRGIRHLYLLRGALEMTMAAARALERANRPGKTLDNGGG